KVTAAVEQRWRNLLVIGRFDDVVALSPDHCFPPGNARRCLLKWEISQVRKPAPDGPDGVGSTSSKRRPHLLHGICNLFLSRGASELEVPRSARPDYVGIHLTADVAKAFSAHSFVLPPFLEALGGKEILAREPQVKALHDPPVGIPEAFDQGP